MIPLARPTPTRFRCRAARLGTGLLLVALAAAPTQADDAPPFRLDSGNAPIELVIPTVVAATLKQVAPGDAPIILRITTIVTNAWFDAIAPYHPTAVGVHSRLPRRPAVEHNDRNRNIAILYATRRVMDSLNPKDAAVWRQMLRSAGLDPDDASTDTATPVGIGNAAGAAIVQARLRDGMNQRGDEGPRGALAQPYADTTGYRPANSAFELRDASRWQPDVVTSGHGVFRIQQAITPQWGRTQYWRARPR